MCDQPARMNIDMGRSPHDARRATSTSTLAVDNGPASGDLFLLRLQLLEVADELLEQFAGLWARFFLKLLEDCLLVGEPREFPRLPDLDAPHVYCLGHDAEKRLGPLVNDSIYCLAPTLQPGGVQVAKEVL